ncbi:MAG TPA: hypothetical protein VFM18_17455 [Methanosarcina sp.]|nr:hypothetical protein [Methanosarcina sp.]
MSYSPIPVDSSGNVPTTLNADGNIVDTFNSNSTPMLANATITNSWVNVLGYSQISTLVYADQPSAVNGFKVDFSTDGANIDHTHSYTITANTGEHNQIPVHAKYYRTRYTNGNVAQSIFRLQTILHPLAGTGTILDADDTISSTDDCLVTKSILTGQSNIDGTYVNAKMTNDGGLIINQNIQVDPLNSSTANLSANAFYIGTTVSNITASMIQIFLKTDQNCIVYLDQSQDGINWDISDSYDYYSAIGNFGINVGAFGAYYRVRVHNIGLVATTFFRLQSIIVPIANQLPRSLSPDGWLQTQINHQQDESGFLAAYTPYGEQLATSSIKLIGSTFPGNSLDTSFWTANVGTGGNVSPINGLLNISTGTTANNYTSLTSVNNARYITGYANKVRVTLTLPDTGTANNTRRGGAYTATDGCFFEMAGTTFSLVTRKAGVDTKVVNGSFNGNLGNLIGFDTNSHSWTILYTPQRIWWYVDEELIHTSSFNTSWTSTLNLPINFENFNTGGSTSNVVMSVFSAKISRQGPAVTQPISKFQNGLTAGVTYKQGAGSLHLINISGITSTANVTLYDSTSASGPIIWSSGSMTIGSQSSNLPFALDFKGVTFNNGLTLTVTTAAAFVTTIFE